MEERDEEGWEDQKKEGAKKRKNRETAAAKKENREVFELTEKPTGYWYERTIRTIAEGSELPHGRLPAALSSLSL